LNLTSLHPNNYLTKLNDEILQQLLLNSFRELAQHSMKRLVVVAAAAVEKMSMKK
jgi:hypothetical protein